MVRQRFVVQAKSIDGPTLFRCKHRTGGNPCSNPTLEPEGITYNTYKYIQTYNQKGGFD